MEVKIGGNTVINSLQIGDNNNMTNLGYGQNQFLNVYWNELEDLLNKQTQTNSLLEEQIKAINEMKGYVKDKDEGGFKRFLKNKGIDLVIKILGGAISKELHEFLVNLS